jgi:hypothetical protein
MKLEITPLHKEEREGVSINLPRWIPIVFFVMTPFVYAQNNGVLDLNNLANYANQQVPPYIAKDNTPANNPLTDAGATLGRVLFYDKKLSVDNTIACASCHLQQHAFGDPAQASSGVNGTTGRHSMRLINARLHSGNNGFTQSLSRERDFDITRVPTLRDLVDASGNLHGGLMHTGTINSGALGDCYGF